MILEALPHAIKEEKKTKVMHKEERFLPLFTGKL
jgi:hypothetical protein